MRIKRAPFVYISLILALAYSRPAQSAKKVQIPSSRATVESTPSATSTPAPAIVSPARHSEKPNQIDNASVKMIEDFLNTSFRIKETLKASLDGSDKAQKIMRDSGVENDLVYYDLSKWRARRALPFSNALSEYLRTGPDLAVQTMTTTNRGVECPYPVSDSVWAEIVLSPFRLAQSFSLDHGRKNLSDWLADLRSAPKNTLSNPEGDNISAIFGADKSVKITSQGKLLVDGKTETSVYSQWEMADVGRVSEKTLQESLFKE